MSKIAQKIIAIDFDGTCVTHEFPKVGKDIGAARVIKRLVEAGHKIILFTMRSNKSGKSPVTNTQENGGLQDAIRWFIDNDIPLFGVNQNPTQSSWTSSPKPYAHVYIDDAALGVPLKSDWKMCDRPFVDWDMVEINLEIQGYLERTNRPFFPTQAPEKFA
jgi:hypothetical protein